MAYAAGRSESTLSPGHKSASSGSSSPSSNGHNAEFIPLAPVAIAPYLEAYGFAAMSPKSWRAAPHGHMPGIGGAAAPTMGLQVGGHKEVEGHTLYTLSCSLADGSMPTTWSAQRRLQQLREDLHDNVKAELGDTYAQHFSATPFAHKGGLPGTSARLNSWLCTLASCINAGAMPPCIVALVLTFLDAPEWKLDTSPVQRAQRKEQLSMHVPGQNTGKAGSAKGQLIQGSGSCALEDVELNVSFDLEDHVLGDPTARDLEQDFATDDGAETKPSTRWS